MSHDDQQQPTDQHVNEDALEATDELSDEALENVSGGNMPIKNFTSPFGDVG
jgi:bacteriocin-like protein